MSCRDEPNAAALFCSRCAARINAAYEPGTCFAADCEPTTMESHDAAQSLEETFGDDPVAFAELWAWSTRDNDRYIEVRRLPGLDEDGDRISGRWTVNLEAEDLAWSHESDGYDEFSRAVRDALKAAREAGLL